MNWKRWLTRQRIELDKLISVNALHNHEKIVKFFRGKGLHPPAEGEWDVHVTSVLGDQTPGVEPPSSLDKQEEESLKTSASTVPIVETNSTSPPSVIPKKRSRKRKTAKKVIKD